MHFQGRVVPENINWKESYLILTSKHADFYVFIF